MGLARVLGQPWVLSCVGPSGLVGPGHFVCPIGCLLGPCYSAPGGHAAFAVAGSTRTDKPATAIVTALVVNQLGSRT